MTVRFIDKERNKKQAEEVAKIVVDETKKLLEDFQMEIQNRFKEVQAQLRIIDTNIELIERKMAIKELNDRQQYGQLHYKIHEVKDKKISQELETLKSKLHLVKGDNSPN